MPIFTDDQLDMWENFFMKHKLWIGMIAGYIRISVFDKYNLKINEIV